MTTADTNATQQPALAGGTARGQLAHLKAHLQFQNQSDHDRWQVHWNTVITRRDSRRHITKAIHEKINRKAAIAAAQAGGIPFSHQAQDRREYDPRQQERQLEMLRDGMRQRRYGFPSGGDWNLICRRLAARIMRACSPDADEDRIQRRLSRYSLDPGEECHVLPHEARFPRDIKYGLIMHRVLRKTLVQQGRSPKRARQTMLREVYGCRYCRQLIAPEALTPVSGYWRAPGQCPACEAFVHYDQKVMVAVLKEDPDRLAGNADVNGRPAATVIGPGQQKEDAAGDNVPKQREREATAVIG